MEPSPNQPRTTAPSSTSRWLSTKVKLSVATVAAGCRFWRQNAPASVSCPSAPRSSAVTATFANEGLLSTQARMPVSAQARNHHPQVGQHRIVVHVAPHHIVCQACPVTATHHRACWLCLPTKPTCSRLLGPALFSLLLLVPASRAAPFRSLVCRGGSPPPPGASKSPQQRLAQHRQNRSGADLCQREARSHCLPTPRSSSAHAPSLQRQPLRTSASPPAASSSLPTKTLVSTSAASWWTGSCASVAPPVVSVPGWSSPLPAPLVLQ